MKAVMQNALDNGAVIERHGVSNTIDESSKRRYSFSLGTLLKRACIITLTILTVSQAVLSVPSVRAAFFFEGADGVSLGSEAYFYIPCRLELSLSNMEACPELKILVNGEAAGSFIGKSVLLELKDGDIVELDASEVLVLPSVRISSASRNIEALLGKTADASGGLVPVAKVNAAN